MAANPLQWVARAGALTCMAFAACSEDAPAPAPPPQATAAAAPAAEPVAKAPAAPAAADAEPQHPYVYSFAGGRDPFRSYLADLHDREEQERHARPHEETERYDLSQYRLTAVLLGRGNPTAMVEDPSGSGHIVKMGSRIGKNDGRIVNIDAAGLSILETFYDGNGQAMQVSAALRLPADEAASSSSP